MTAPHRTKRGGRGGGTVKLVVCIRGGDNLQAINQQTKIFFYCHQDRMLKHHKCHYPTGPRGEGGNTKKAQSSLSCALVGVTTCKPSTSKPKSFLIVAEQNAREPQVPAPHRTMGGGGGGKLKEDVVKLWGGGPPGRNHKCRVNHIKVFKA